jgi:20S proteasome subunit beta 6
MSGWSAYDNNGGTVVAVAVGDRVVVAGDTRISTSYSIVSRKTSKLCVLTPKVVLATSGMLVDAQVLQKTLQAHVANYLHKQGQLPSLEACARLLSNILYSRRFFPYYTFNLLAGIDSTGKGAVYGYDAIGSFDRLAYGAQGTGIELLVPVLDNQLKGSNQTNPQSLTTSATGEAEYSGDPLELVKNIVTSCAERDIYTGDTLELLDLTSAGITRHEVPLRSD